MTFSPAEGAAAVVRLSHRLAASGLVVGTGGNVSVRTGDGEIMVTPSGFALDELTATDLVAIDLDGQVRSSAGGIPSSESHMHVAAHLARPEMPVVVHVHPPYANLLAALGHPIRLITLDHAYYVRRMARVPYLPSGSIELADAVAAQLAGADVVILAHHGCLVVAADAGAAYERVANLEAAATATYRALLLGDTTTVCPPEYMARILARELAAAVGKDR